MQSWIFSIQCHMILQKSFNMLYAAQTCIIIILKSYYLQHIVVKP